MADDIGALRVSLSANIAEFETTLNKAKSILGSTQSSFSKDLQKITNAFKGPAIAIGGLVTAATAAGGVLFGLAKQAANLGEELHNAAIKSGASVELLSALKLSAELANSSLGDLETGFKFLNKSIAESAEGIKSKGSTALKNLGISVTDLKGNIRSLDDIFPEIVGKLAQVGNSAQKVQISMALLGKSGSNLLPLMKDLADEGFDNVIQRARDLGLIMSTETAAAADRMNDSLDIMFAALKGVSIQIGSQLIPVVTAVTEGIVDWIKENRNLITDQEKTHKVLNFVLDAVENLAKGLKVGLQVGIVFGKGLQTAFNFIQSAANGALAIVGKVAEGILKLNKLLSSPFFAALSGRLPISKEQLNVLDQEISFFHELASISLKGLNQQMGDLESSTKGFGTALGNIGDTSDVEKIFDKIRESANKANVSLTGTTGGGEGGGESGGVSGGIKQTTKALKESIPVLKEVSKVWKEFQSQVSTITLLPGIDIPILKTLKGLPEATEPAFEEIQKQGKDTFDALDAFIGDTLGAIRNNMADFVDNFLAGKIKSIGDFFQGIVTALRRNIAQLISAIVTAPLENALKSALSGGKGFLSSLSSLFGGGSGTNPPASEGRPGRGGIFGGAANALLVASPVIGAILGGITAGIPGAIKGATTGLGAIGGFLLGGPLGAAIGAGIGTIAGDLIGLLFKEKKPKLNISIGVLDQVGDRIANVGDFITALEDRTTAAAQDLIEINKRKFGADTGELRQQLLEIINQQGIKPIQDIINQFPAEVAKGLSEALKSTPLSADSKALLDLHVSGKHLAEQLQSHLGELGADFQFAIRPIFAKILEAVGIEAQKAAAFIEEQFKGFKDLSAEERTAFGQQFIAEMNTIVQFLGGAFSDATAQALSAMQSLATELGFDAIPSIDQLKKKLIEMINASDLPAGTVEKFKQLRDAIVSLTFSIADSVNTIVGQIADLNSKIQGLGGAGIALPTGAIKTAIASIQALIQGGNLSTDELQQALTIMGQLTDQLVNVQLQAQQKAMDAAIAGIQSQIDLQETLKDLAIETKRKELDGLKEALRTAEQFKQEFERIGDDLRNLFAGANSVLNPIERLNFLQGEVAKAKQALAGATTEEDRLAAIDKLRELSGELIDLGSSAFGTSSPEFQSLFTQVADELQGLLDLTEGEAKKTDTLNEQIAKVEKQLEEIPKQFDLTIKALQSQLASLQAAGNQLTGVAAADARAFYTFIQGKYFELLKLKLEQLGQVGTTEVDLLGNIGDQLHGIFGELVSIRKAVGGTISAQSGFHGVVMKPTMIRTHPNEMIDISPLRGMSNRDLIGNETVVKHDHTFRILLEGKVTQQAVDMFARGIPRAFDDYLKSGRGREIVKSIKK